MHTHTNKTSKSKRQPVGNSLTKQQSENKSTFGFTDNRPASIAEMERQQSIQNNAPVQKKENNTGLPDSLKSGAENLSGFSLDDVKVHYNSGKPVQLNAHAYAQGTEIHIAPGQEKYLPHEAWHVVQQKQGRVKPTMQMKGNVNINDEAGLEKEADKMGKEMVRLNPAENKINRKKTFIAGNNLVEATVQKKQRQDGKAGGFATNGLVVQLGNTTSASNTAKEEKKKPGEAYEGPSEAEKSKAISNGYDELLLVAAAIAQENSKRFRNWTVDQVVKDADVINWLVPAAESEEGKTIISRVANECWNFDCEDITRQILAETGRRKQAHEIAKAGDRRLAEPVADSKINELVERLLHQYPVPITEYHHDIVKNALQIAKYKLIQQYGYQLSMNQKGALDQLENLVKIAQAKGYPVEDQAFVDQLIEIAIALNFKYTSGSENADKEDAGGDKAKTKR